MGCASSCKNPSYTAPEKENEVHCFEGGENCKAKKSADGGGQLLLGTTRLRGVQGQVCKTSKSHRNKPRALEQCISMTPPVGVEVGKT